MATSPGTPERAWLDEPALLEALAAVEHERWSHWQRYMHSQCTQNADGTLTIPAELVTRWTTQIATDYSRLADSEKESDREQAREYLTVLRRFPNRSPGPS